MENKCNKGRKQQHGFEEEQQDRKGQCPTKSSMTTLN
jgi:hypothetical protein